jgi:hypothetical protein
LDLEAELLLAILAETRRVESLDPYWLDTDTMARFSSRRIAVDDLTKIGVPLQGIGETDGETARKRRQRTLKRLESLGWVELHAKYVRAMSHAKLTTAGRAEAERLSACPR